MISIELFSFGASPSVVLFPLYCVLREVRKEIMGRNVAWWQSFCLTYVRSWVGASVLQNKVEQNKKS